RPAGGGGGRAAQAGAGGRSSLGTAIAPVQHIFDGVKRLLHARQHLVVPGQALLIEGMLLPQTPGQGEELVIEVELLRRQPLQQVHALWQGGLSHGKPPRPSPLAPSAAAAGAAAGWGCRSSPGGSRRRRRAPSPRR